MNKDIWDKYNFSEEKGKDAGDYLRTLLPDFEEKTGRELILQVEGVDAYTDEGVPRLVAVYKLFVVAPKMGNFRRKLLSVVAYRDRETPFPVDIYNHFAQDAKISDVTEAVFMDRIAEVLNGPTVKHMIEGLYRDSKEFNRGTQS